MLVSDQWNSLEVTKLVASLLTPLLIAGFGWFISRRLKRLELLQWSNQKLIEKRILLYDSVAPQLNQLFCFYTWVGHWKDISPADVMRLKRELDQCMHIYRHLFTSEVFERYGDLMDLLFETYQDAGEDAKIRSAVRGPDGDRAIHSSCEWSDAWSSMFAAKSKVAPISEIRRAYFAVMEALTKSLGVVDVDS